MNNPASDTQWMADAYRAAHGNARPSGILIVDDHDLVRLGMRALIASQSSQAGSAIQVFEVKSLAAAIEVYRANHTAIGLVLLDLELSDSTGLQGLASFKAIFSLAKVVVLSGESDDRTIQKAIALGATAYLRKTADLSDVISHIRSHGLFERAHAETQSSREGGASSSHPGGLRPRHSQILAPFLQGRSSSEISQLTCLAVGADGILPHRVYNWVNFQSAPTRNAQSQ